MKNTKNGHRVPASSAQLASAPAKAGSPAAPCATPALYPKEVYVGISLGADGIERHVILLPGDTKVGSIEDAEDFVASIYGELPTYAELKHIHSRAPASLKPSLYYTCEQDECDGDVCTMLFDAASPLWSARGMVEYIRVRAVRRVLVNPDIGPAIGITAHQVDALSEHLLRQYAALIDENSDGGDRAVNAGIRLGIGLMTNGVQHALAEAQRRQGGDHA